ncbi:MarR family winged helix-turn-helix transcriptional regulator [Actinoplanes sp. DH11]|uniref:MarR family winged helix-turn-helix transcriptional regulator n=1 Tax=Actinoplanes sp. DH11 TaxID=2857011 RepID=UPI001E2B6485|nr:MarR family transcriptional regulator [Actinoplanes sp. DH11]
MATDRVNAAGDGAVVDALLALSRVFVGMAARSLAAVDEDVTLPQFRTLVLLVSRGALRAVDLAQELDVTPSTASRMGDRLIRKGLVARYDDPADRRASRFALTAAGRDLLGEAMRRREAAIAAVVAAMPTTGPVDLAAAVNAFVAAAGDMPQEQWWARWSGGRRPGHGRGAGQAGQEGGVGQRAGRHRPTGQDRQAAVVEPRRPVPL